jgi:hypothetical protein
MMSGDLDWTAALGEAVVADQGQRARRHPGVPPQGAGGGNLKSDTKQTVVVEKEVVTIVPADPQVIYVPQYNPTTVVVSGSAAWGYYPNPYPVYYYPYPPGAALATGIIWGAAIGAIWGGNHYGAHYGGNANINVNRNTNINTGDINRGNNVSNRPAGGAGAGGGSTPWKSNKQPGQVSSSVGGSRPARAGDGPSAATANTRQSVSAGTADRSTADRGSADRGSADRGSARGGRVRRRPRRRRCEQQRVRRLRLRPADADGQLARRLQPQHGIKPRCVAEPRDVGRRRRRPRRRRWRPGRRRSAMNANLVDGRSRRTSIVRWAHSLRAAWRFVALAACLSALAAGGVGSGSTDFATPEAAVAALSAALKANDERALVAIVGEKHKALITTGDAAADAARRAESRVAVALYGARRQRAGSPRPADRRARLAAADPLVRERGAWRFASEQGIEEMLNRPRRCERASGGRRAARVRRGPAPVRIARPGRRRRARLREQAHQQPRQARRPLLARRRVEGRGSQPVRAADRTQRALPRRATRRATPIAATTSAS